LQRELAWQAAPMNMLLTLDIAAAITPAIRRPTRITADTAIPIARTDHTTADRITDMERLITAVAQS
jgi:hypothetical protein